MRQLANAGETFERPMDRGGATAADHRYAGSGAAVWNCSHGTGPRGGLAAGLVRGASAFAKQLRSSGELAAILLMMLAGAAGLGSLWLNILFGRDWAFARARRRYGLVGALVAGLAAAAYWFLRLDVPPHEWRELKAFWVWIALLGAPCAIAVRYLCILLASGRSAEATRHPGSNS